MKNPALNASLHARGLTVERLAWAIGSSRAHVTLVLGNTPGRGGKTRGRLAPLLSPRERALVGWDEEGRPVERSPRNTPILDRFRFSGRQATPENGPQSSKGRSPRPKLNQASHEI